MLNPIPAIPRVVTAGAALAAAFLTGCVVHPIPHHHRAPGVVIVDPGYPGGPGYGHGHRHRHHHHRDRQDRHDDRYDDRRGHHGR